MRPIDPREFLDRMTLPVWQAMAAVRWLEGRVKNRPKPSELTPEKAALTDGDCVSQEILLVALRAHYPDVSVSVEEDTPTTACFSRDDGSATVVVDPIDGTLRYLLGDGPYAILIGLEIDGRVEASLVAIPQRNLLIRATRGGGADRALDGCSARPCPLLGQGSELLVSHALPGALQHRLRAQGLELSVAAGGVIGVAPLLEGVRAALRLAAGPEGLSRRAWVAALPVLEAGGCVETLSGPLPERYVPWTSGILVARDAADIQTLRSLL